MRRDAVCELRPRMDAAPTDGPDVEPVSIEQAKLRLRLPIDVTDENQTLTGLIASARQSLERQAGLALITQTWTIAFSGWPIGPLYLPMRPLQRVLTVKYYDTSGTLQTWDPANYLVSTKNGSLAPVPMGTWPVVQPGRDEAVIVTAVFGYGDDEASVPELLKTAVLMTVCEWFDGSRQGLVIGATVNELPHGVRAVLTPLAVPRRRMTAA